LSQFIVYKYPYGKDQKNKERINMKSSIRITIGLFAALSLLLLSACDKPGNNANTSSAQTNAEDNPDVVVIINGSPVTKTRLAAYLKQRAASRPAPSTKEEREQIINEIVNMELLVQDAVQKGLDKLPQVTSELENHRHNVLAGAAFREYLRANPITDDKVQKAYDERKANLAFSEYKARHILVKTEEAAKEIIARLDKGENFVKLARKLSTGPSAKKGGDLGWFAAADMVKPFSDAVKALKKGKYSEVPVKTQFGYHVILKEDSRDLPPPSFVAAKDKLRNDLQRELIEAYIDGLRKKAVIKFIEPKKPEVSQAPANTENPAKKGPPDSITPYGGD